jgi:hypothetical protein
MACFVLRNDLAYYAKMSENKFGKWLDNLIDKSGLKKKNIALEAGIHYNSLSRIISGVINVTPETATSVMQALNKLSGRELADINTGLRMVVGMEQDDFSDGFFAGYEKLSEDRKKLAKKQIAAIIDTLSEQEFTDKDFDYIDD